MKSTVSKNNFNYRTLLTEEFEKRTSRNSRYSLRSFARDIGISSSRLSEILNEKCGLSRNRALLIAKKLGLSGSEIERFGDLVEAEHGRSALRKEIAKKKLQAKEIPENQQLQMDAFRIISDWYHYAILELTHLRGFKSDISWIAKNLNISVTEVQLALGRLERLELIEWQNNKLIAKESFLASPDGVPSDSLKKFHSQILDKIKDSIYLQTVEERNLSAIVLAFNSQNYTEATSRIKTFRREFNRDFGHDVAQKNLDLPDSVYCLAIQFFKITKPIIGEIDETY